MNNQIPQCSFWWEFQLAGFQKQNEPIGHQDIKPSQEFENGQGNWKNIS